MLDEQEKEEQSTDIVSTITPAQKLLKKSDELIDKIIDEDNPDNLQDLTALFNMNQVKKNMLRVSKLDEILDLATEEAGARLRNPSTLENDEIVNYMKVLQTNLEKSQSVVNKVPEVPMIQINQQNNVGIISDEDSAKILSRESREKVSDVIQEILRLSKQPIVADDTEDE